MRKIFSIVMILISSFAFSQTSEHEVINQLMTQLEESTSVIEELRDDNVSLNETVNELETENEELRKALEDEEYYTQQIQEYEDSIGEYENQINNLVDRLEESNETIAMLRDRIEDDQEEIIDLRTRINELIPLVDDSTFGVGMTYNFPTGISILGEFKIPNFPISVIGQTGYFNDNNFIYGGVGLKLEF